MHLFTIKSQEIKLNYRIGLSSDNRKLVETAVSASSRSLAFRNWKKIHYESFSSSKLSSEEIVFSYNAAMIILSVSLFSGEYGVQSSTISVSSCRHSMCHLSSWQSRSQQSSKTLPCRSVLLPYYRCLQLVVWITLATLGGDIPRKVDSGCVARFPKP